MPSAKSRPVSAAGGAETTCLTVWATNRCAQQRVLGERLPIEAGDVVFIPAGPEYPRHIINTSVAPLRYLSLSTNETPEVCKYPDSGKLMAYSSKDGQTTLRSMHPRASAVDYWEGEAQAGRHA